MIGPQLQLLQPTTIIGGEVDGSLAIAFYAAECFSSHDGYQIMYSLVFGITLRVLVLVLYIDIIYDI